MRYHEASYFMTRIEKAVEKAVSLVASKVFPGDD
jgi:hypothetical protein